MNTGTLACVSPKSNLTVESLMIWTPHVTVAAVLAHENRFLLVEEHTHDGVRYNQPAGHLECGESLVQAVRRETREETAYDFLPEALLGIHQWRREDTGITFLRFVFTGPLLAHDPAQPLDADIIAAHWLTLEEIRARQHQLRSPMVMRCIEDYRKGEFYPLSLIAHYA